jgi:hypothetical protein
MPSVATYRESDVGDGLRLFRGIAEGNRGVQIRFALLAGNDAVGKASDLPFEKLTGASLVQASSPVSSGDLLFVTTEDNLRTRQRRNAVSDVAIALEERLFDTVRN